MKRFSSVCSLALLVACFSLCTRGLAAPSLPAPGGFRAYLQNNCGSNLTIKVRVGACFTGWVQVPPGTTFDFVQFEVNACGSPLNACNGPYQVIQGPGAPGGVQDGFTFMNAPASGLTAPNMLQYGGGNWGAGTLGLCGPSSVTNLFTVDLRNNSNGTRTYQVCDMNGNPIPGARGATWISLPPGGTGQLQFASGLLGNQWQIQSWSGPGTLSGYGGGNFSYSPNDNSVGVAMNQNGDGAFNTTVNPGSSYGSGYVPSTFPGFYPGAPLTIYSNPASWGSNQPIAFAPGSDLTNTLQTGFSALYSALNNGFGTLDGDLRQIGGKIDNLTNYVGGGGSGTNGAWTGGTNMVSAVDTTGTNYGAAESAGQSALSSGISSVDSAISGASGIAGVDDYAGGVSTVTIETGVGNPSFNINLLDDASFSALWAVIRTTWAWLLCAAYAVKVINDLHNAFTEMGFWHGTKIENMNLTVLGTGGNFAGTTVAALVVVAVLAAYAALVAAAFAALVGPLSFSALWGYLTLNPLAGAPIQGLRLVGAMFPLSLFFSLIGAYIVFRLTMIKVGLICLAAIKFLFGA